MLLEAAGNIYNSRNFESVFDAMRPVSGKQSTTVEILNQYLTNNAIFKVFSSTTVEILNQYLTNLSLLLVVKSTTVEILNQYLTAITAF